MKNETKNEKIIRLSLIVIISIITMLLFKVQFQMFTFSSDDSFENVKLQVEVLQVMDENNESPIVAMVKDYEGKPMLVTYRINVNDNFRFETIQAVELKEVPNSISKNASSNDVWVELKDEFTLFTKELDVVKTQLEKPVKKTQEQYNIQISEMDTVQYLIEVYKNDIKVVQKAIQQKPVHVHKLSTDDSLWLIQLEEDVMLLFS
ncbi:hypothetical protein [Bacillus alkalisoli]|uniref:hypothetical protein n=1 Tax=Bacillus alkalisoli TaxID=2011008 RepID=UPI000C248C6E|nr:hypothetical protein [Bacillus alkalisoli]